MHPTDVMMMILTGLVLGIMISAVVMFSVNRLAARKIIATIKDAVPAAGTAMENDAAGREVRNRHSRLAILPRELFKNYIEPMIGNFYETECNWQAGCTQCTVRIDMRGMPKIFEGSPTVTHCYSTVLAGYVDAHPKHLVEYGSPMGGARQCFVIHAENSDLVTYETVSAYEPGMPLRRHTMPIEHAISELPLNTGVLAHRELYETFRDASRDECPSDDMLGMWHKRNNLDDVLGNFNCIIVDAWRLPSSDDRRFVMLCVPPTDQIGPDKTPLHFVYHTWNYQMPALYCVYIVNESTGKIYAVYRPEPLLSSQYYAGLELFVHHSGVIMVTEYIVRCTYRGTRDRKITDDGFDHTWRVEHTIRVRGYAQ